MNNQVEAGAPMRASGFKVQHRCKVDRAKTPPETSDHMLNLIGVPTPIDPVDARAVCINGTWFVQACDVTLGRPAPDPASQNTLHDLWEKSAP